MTAQRATPLNELCLSIEEELVAAAHARDVGKIDELLDLLRLLGAYEELESAIVASIRAGDNERTLAARRKLLSLPHTFDLGPPQ